MRSQLTHHKITCHLKSGSSIIIKEPLPNPPLPFGNAKRVRQGEGATGGWGCFTGHDIIWEYLLLRDSLVSEMFREINL